MPVATERFSSRVENYVRYRPHYPRELVEFLQEQCGLTAESVIADIGSGTGFLAELFLKNGNQVFGIEPNKEMREAAERFLGHYRRFASVAATAEATTVPDSGIDFVTAGQAFHWFDRESCRKEFARILRPGGWVVLAWNDRHTDTTPFLIAYEQLLRDFGTDYDQVNHKRIDGAVIRDFFHAVPKVKIFPNYQHFDFPALKGRLLSSSYVPESGQPRYEEMLDALKSLFDMHEQDGIVTFDYDTLIYYGRLG
jgi:SAM-dependent methyltransferase